MAKILDGKAVSAALKETLKNEVLKLSEDTGKNPCLAVVIVGDDPASRVYVNNKKKTCEELGIISKEYELGGGTTTEELLDLVDRLNADEQVNGILVQLPLPKTIDSKKILERINPVKDVDAFHPMNVGRIMTGEYAFLPCTPAGIMEILSFYDIDVTGKNAVVVGRSNIVGKPMALLLLQKDATVTICHSRTQNLAEVTKNADILVAAIGKSKMFTADMIKKDAVLIDVGMNRIDGKLTGDIDYDGCFEKAGYITPVPGGVGVMTVTVLMKNTLTAFKLQNNV